MHKQTVIILGSGLAALTAARELRRHFNVRIITKNPLGASSWKAQGGIAAAVCEEDGGLKHKLDTLKAGSGHSNADAVSIMVREGAEAVKRMIADGMVFDHGLGLEGAHSARRIFRAGGDSTGKKMMGHMLDHCHDVEMDEKVRAVDLLVEKGVCTGVLVKHVETGRLERMKASAVVIATGGYSGLFEVTSNDPTLTGEGIAMAYRAGAVLSDLEFVQFHPTLLYRKKMSYGLLSEALRGEGARLVTSDGKYVMDHHPLKDLAPRDIVSRTLHRSLRNGAEIYLDISSTGDFSLRFPTAAAQCMQAGLNASDKKLPVRPGAHFTIGGIGTNTDGETSVPGLYAVGESACTGVHGANRLASNSLLEAVVFAERAAHSIIRRSAGGRRTYTAEGGIQPAEKECAPVMPPIGKIRRHVSEHAGIERDREGLEKLTSWLDEYSPELHFHSFRGSWTLEEIETSNCLIVASLLASSALMRKESRGTHWRSDFPEQDDPRWAQRPIRRQRNRKIQTEQEVHLS
ncbi:L-aspartate oxidase [Alteribacter natronophilus]|uniref:L-aspartate oxidase n=1 Tax=Alteribacter natronophilus TaxID=2583810 RepID=UPI001FE49DA1|nr:L-aspartate oxidase [Alteribacter natronophilus]